MLSWLLGPKSLATQRDAQFWRDCGFLEKTSSGVAVNERTALTFAAVYRAVSLIAGSAAMLPLHVYQRVSDIRRKRQQKHRLEYLLNFEPNPNMDAATFRESMTANLLLWGNGYALRSLAGGHTWGLDILEPRRVRPKIGEDGAIEYEVRNRDGKSITLDRSETFHLKNIGGDGLVGWSVIKLAQESIGLGKAAEKFGAGFFGKGAKPGGVVSFKSRPHDGAVDTFRETWNEMHQGLENAHKVAVLTQEATFTPISMPLNEAQFLETRQFQLSEIARWFGVPAHMLGDLSRSTNNNIEQQGLEFLTYCLLYWLNKWERAAARQLLTPEEVAEGYYLEHQVEALLRGDAASRYAAYTQARNIGVLNGNDIRAKENMDSIGPAGDVYLVPANMVPAEDYLPENRQKQQQPGAVPPANNPPPGRSPVPGPTTPAKNAFLPLLEDVLGQLQRKEEKNILQAAKDPKEFTAWLETWPAKHETEMAARLSPVLRAVGRERPEDLAVAIAAAWARRTREDLEKLVASVPRSGLATAAAELAAGLGGRAAELAAGILGQGPVAKE